MNFMNLILYVHLEKPGAVLDNGSPDLMMIDTKPLIPILTKCIQGNRQEIKDLKNKVDDLEKKNTHLVNKVYEIQLKLDLLMQHLKL